MNAVPYETSTCIRPVLVKNTIISLLCKQMDIYLRKLGEGQNWVTVSGYMPIYGDWWYIWYQNVEWYLLYKSVQNLAVYYKYVVWTERWNDTGVWFVLLLSLRHDSAHFWCASTSLTWSIHLHIGVTIYRKGLKWTRTDRNGLAKVEIEFIWSRSPKTLETTSK